MAQQPAPLVNFSVMVIYALVYSYLGEGGKEKQGRRQRQLYT